MSFQTKVYVPVANETANNFESEVIGNKTDSAVATVGTDKSLVAYIKGILNTVLSISTQQTEIAIYGPQTVDVDNTGHFELTLVDKDVGLVPLADITPGTYQLKRIRAGVSTDIGAASTWSKANGRVYVDITFEAANWSTDDSFQIVPAGDTSYVVGATTLYPPLPTISGIILDISTIESKIDTIDNNLDSLIIDVGDGSATSLGSVVSILGDPTSPISTVLGTNIVLAVGGGSIAADQSVQSLVRYVTDAVGSPIKDAVASSISLILGDPGSSDISTLLGAILPLSAMSDDLSGTYSLLNDTNKQTVVELTTSIRKIVSGVWLDLVNITQTGTIGIEFKVDGLNYRVVTTEAYDPLTMEDAQYIDLNMGITSDIKVTYQASIAEGSAKDIPYSMVYLVVE